MKKALKIVSIIAVIAVVVMPLIGFAQQPKQAECCRLSQDIKMDDVTYGCDIVGDGPCGAAADCAYFGVTTTFEKNLVVGSGDCLMGTGDECDLKGVTVPIVCETQEWGTICLLNSLYNVTNWIFFFFLAIAILIGVLSGYMFMTAAGDPGKVEKARALLMYMTIGLVIAAVAKVIPTLVRTVVGF